MHRYIHIHIHILIDIDIYIYIYLYIYSLNSACTSGYLLVPYVADPERRFSGLVTAYPGRFGCKRNKTNVIFDYLDGKRNKTNALFCLSGCRPYRNTAKQKVFDLILPIRMLSLYEHSKTNGFVCRLYRNTAKLVVLCAS